MDKYNILTNDPYCYNGTTVLKNKLNIQDSTNFEKAEREITASTICNIKYKKPPYNLEYLQDLHQELFGELYAWAGKLRTVDISKGDTDFCLHWNIESQSNDLFKKLKSDEWLKGLDENSFCEKLAEHYCDFNMLHPFREGNGRTQRLFFEHLALHNEYIIDWNTIISTDEWIQANIDGVIDHEPMAEIFNRVLRS